MSKDLLLQKAAILGLTGVTALVTTSALLLITIYLAALFMVSVIFDAATGFVNSVENGGGRGRTAAGSSHSLRLPAAGAAPKPAKDRA